MCDASRALSKQSVARAPRNFDERGHFARKQGKAVVVLARTKGALIAALVLASACAPSRDLPLLALERVTPARVHEGSALVVEGAGFPAGRRGTLTLRGKAYVPGGRARSIEVSREAIA